MAKSTQVSETVIRRMPIYSRYLRDIIDKGIERISSSELSKLTGFTASQIRQDLNNFGGFGQQGYGYNTVELKRQIDKILGMDHQYKTIVIGAGRLGQALSRYQGFKTSGFDVLALFDIKEMEDVDGISVLPMEELVNFVQEHQVEVAIITVPKTGAVEIAKQLMEHGIKGIWNFSPIDITPRNGVVVENIRLNDSLLTLSYYMKEAKEK